MDRGFKQVGTCTPWHGAHEGADPEAMQDVTQLTPPQRSFWHKCGSTSTVSPLAVDQVAGHRRWRPAAGTRGRHGSGACGARGPLRGPFGRGRFQGPEVDVDALRAEIEAEVRAELKADASIAASEPDEDRLMRATLRRPRPPPRPPKPRPRARRAPSRRGPVVVCSVQAPKMTYDGPEGGKQSGSSRTRS